MQQFNKVYRYNQLVRDKKQQQVNQPPPSKPPRLNSPTSNNNSKTRNSTINATSAAAAAIQDSVAHANPMKVFHGVFDPLHTSTKVPSALMQEMKRVLNMNREYHIHKQSIWIYMSNKRM